MEICLEGRDRGLRRTRPSGLSSRTGKRDVLFYIDGLRRESQIRGLRYQCDVVGGVLLDYIGETTTLHRDNANEVARVHSNTEESTMLLR